MKKFESLNYFVEITKKASSLGLKNINCYLMPDEINKLIESNSLFYMQNENTLQIIIKKGCHVKVCFQANDGFKFIPFESELPIIADLPFSNEMNEKLKNFQTKLENQGFALNSCTTRMSCSEFEEQNIQMGEYKIEEFNPAHLNQVYEIWEENFDAVANLLYSKNEILSCENPIYVLRNKDNQVVGAMELVINGRYGWVQKIAIKKDWQGQGLGGILEKFYINKCKLLGIKTLLLYTIDSNLNAQKFHKKYGFKPDGKFNCQFIYRR